ncbi:MAG: ABC transporter ATP-binding protein [Anaerolineae bacterium]|nr:ABC transporter ATP-binding protein [Anaerolineae bacterium]
MLRILKYLKPFLPFILLNIVLLFLQANADLALPDYMSHIINIGIQQGGVESTVPQALRQNTFEHLLLFLNKDEQAMMQMYYRQIDNTTPNVETYRAQYPALAEQPLYILQDSGATAAQQLTPFMGESLVIVTGIEQMMTNPAASSALLPSMGNFDPSKLPPGADVFALLSRLPEAQRMQIRSAVRERFAAIGGEKALTQAAARAVKAEYEALGMDTLRLQNTYILRVGGQMLLIALVSAIATITVGFLSARTAAGLARDLRRFLFEKVMRFSSAELERFSIASLITRSTNDISQIQIAVMIMMRMVIYAPIIGIGGILRALTKSASMWWVIALAVIVLLGIVTTIFSIVTPRFRIIQALMDRLNLIARENLSGMMVVRAFNRETYETQRFDRANRELTQTTLFVNRTFVAMMPLMMLLMNGLSVLIIWAGGQQVAQMRLQVGDMMAFMQYAMQIVFAFMMLSMLFILLPRAGVAANRVADVLETNLTILDPPHPKTFPEPFRGRIEFRQVSFRYPDAEEDVLHNLTFTIPAGQTVGIIGTTGSGKSTLVNLILRFYDVTEGAIYMDGVDIRQVRLSDLRDKIGYVPQQSNLFSGTVESNLRYAAEDAAEETLRQALETAQAADFILTQPDGLTTPVSQGGVNFSGGQRQRLSIARALAKRPPIYIFDDSFSALDYQTDARLRRALKQSVRGSTVIIVSQRVATIKDADQILVLDEGRLLCADTHEELLRKCAVYREIALSQLKLREETLV